MMVNALLLILATSIAGATGPNDCQAYLDRDLTFDEVFPPNGDPGPAAHFLYATQDALMVLGELNRGPDQHHTRQMADDLHQALDDQHPSVRYVMVNVIGLDDLYPGFPMQTFVGKEAPLRILPAEWQKELLERLRPTPPPFTTPAMLDRLIAASALTKFRLRPSDTGKMPEYLTPSQRLADVVGALNGEVAGITLFQPRDLDPQSGGLQFLLDAIIDFYFPSGGPIDGVELRRALNKHLKFWIANPLGISNH